MFDFFDNFNFDFDLDFDLDNASLFLLGAAGVVAAGKAILSAFESDDRKTDLSNSVSESRSLYENKKQETYCNMLSQQSNVLYAKYKQEKESYKHLKDNIKETRDVINKLKEKKSESTGAEKKIIQNNINKLYYCLSKQEKIRQELYEKKNKSLEKLRQSNHQRKQTSNSSSLLSALEVFKAFE